MRNNRTDIRLCIYTASTFADVGIVSEWNRNLVLDFTASPSELPPQLPGYGHALYTFYHDPRYNVGELRVDQQVERLRATGRLHMDRLHRQTDYNMTLQRIICAYAVRTLHRLGLVHPLIWQSQ